MKSKDEIIKYLRDAFPCVSDADIAEDILSWLKEAKKTKKVDKINKFCIKGFKFEMELDKLKNNELKFDVPFEIKEGEILMKIAECKQKIRELEQK